MRDRKSSHAGGKIFMVPGGGSFGKKEFAAMPSGALTADHSAGIAGNILRG
jgi:hypothetical protein